MCFVPQCKVLCALYVKHSGGINIKHTSISLHVVFYPLHTNVGALGEVRENPWGMTY